jgi:hypothetical protein
MSEPHFGMFHLRELDVGWSACRTIWAVESLPRPGSPRRWSPARIRGRQLENRNRHSARLYFADSIHHEENGWPVCHS